MCLLQPAETPESVLATRRRTIQKVQRIIREKYGKQYLVECFGSTQYGVDAATSDLDLVVLVSFIKGKRTSSETCGLYVGSGQANGVHAGHYARVLARCVLTAYFRK